MIGVFANPTGVTIFFVRQPLVGVMQDVLCTFPLPGQAFAIGSYNSLVDADINAFDNNVTSVWTALCVSGGIH